MPSLVVVDVDEEIIPSSLSVLPETDHAVPRETNPPSQDEVKVVTTTNASTVTTTKRKRSTTSTRPKGQMTLQGFFTQKKKSKTTNAETATTLNSNAVNNENKIRKQQQSPEILVWSDPVHKNNDKKNHNTHHPHVLDSVQDSKRHELLQIVMGKRVAAAATVAASGTTSTTTTPTVATMTDGSITTATTTCSSSSASSLPLPSQTIGTQSQPQQRKMVTAAVTHSPPSTTTTTTTSSSIPSNSSMDHCPSANRHREEEDNDPPRATRRTDEKPEPNRLNFEAEVVVEEKTKITTESSKSSLSHNKNERNQESLDLATSKCADTKDIQPNAALPMDSLQQLVEVNEKETLNSLTPQDGDTRSLTTTSSQLLPEENKETQASPTTFASLETNNSPKVQSQQEDSFYDNPQSSNHKENLSLILLLQQHEKTRETYTRRALELLERVRDMERRQDHPLVDVQFENAPEKSTDEFPDVAVPLLASIIEGRSEPLTLLTKLAADILAQRGLTSLPTEQIADKIKRLATRKNPIKNPHLLRATPSFEPTAAPAVPLNVFEDENQDYLWRWEVTILEILPESTIAIIKKARAARKKITSHLNALLKLIATIQEVCLLLVNEPNVETNNNNKSLEPILARISQEEEKVLKYEREEEKNRLAAHAKRQKEIAKEEARIRKQEEQMQRKERAAEEKRIEKERKKEQAEALKQQKAAEKEEQERKERALKEASRKKQEKCLLSFFGNAATSSSQKSSQRHSISTSRSTTQEELRSNGIDSFPTTSMTSETFPVEEFRSKITRSSLTGKLPIFPKLSLSARQSRRRRAKQITVPVYVTLYPEGYDESNPFSQQQPYAELQDVQVRNKYKFLSFHEDIRPAYYGTWSKTSRVITGRNPFAKDTAFLDYDVDSEAEWEEGDDDEMGEELGDDKADENEDKEMEDADGDDADGWLAPDDEVEEELDEEAKQLLRKKKIENEEIVKRALTVCYIAPLDSGRPWNVVSPETVPKGKVEGFDSVDDALALMKRLTAMEVTNLDVCLDAFPPSEDFDANQDAAQNPQTNTNGQGLTEEQMKVFVQFVHNNTLGSKDKLIEELLKSQKSATNSRAQAFRVLDSVAEKKTDPLRGIFWEVKRDVLENLGLTELACTNMFASDDAKQENMKTIARFIHHCTTSSKEKIVDDLRVKHPTATSSRAEAMRILLSISDKKKHPVSGFYWEVKKDICEELGLKDFLLNEPPPLDHSFKTNSATTDASCLATETQVRAIDENIASHKKKKLGGDLAEKSSLKRPAALNGQAKLLTAFLRKSKK
jgi:hypothetical protein